MDVYNFQNTAQPPGDYSFASTKITVTFYGGQSQFLPIKFDVTDDDKVENDESFYVFVAANNDVRTTEPALSTVSIKDNDGELLCVHLGPSKLIFSSWFYF